MVPILSYSLRICLVFTKSSVSGSIFELSVIDHRSGFIVFSVSGKKARNVFKNEPGGHRWQRIPPTEKRGRVHTSTITVAVLEPQKAMKINLKPDELEIKTTRGSGSGGQHRNKVETAVVVKHLPSGIVVRCENSRSQDTNKENALFILESRLKEIESKKAWEKRKNKRKDQVGSGMRGDKVRTIQVRNDNVTDHKSGKKTTYKKYKRGDFSDLF